MSTAGLSHWWSIREFSAALRSTTASAPLHAPAVPAKTPEPLATAAPAPAPNARQKEFYEALIAKMDGLQNQNRDLLDQLAETNRDLMKLEFRVDTHSESFRPMPVSEDRPFTTSLDTDAGVLPPRARPVVFPLHD